MTLCGRPAIGNSHVSQRKQRVYRTPLASVGAQWVYCVLQRPAPAAYFRLVHKAIKRVTYAWGSHEWKDGRGKLNGYPTTTDRKG